VKRYGPVCGAYEAMQEFDDGEYVLYSDHLADRASLLAVLRQCVGWMEDQFCPEDARCAKCSYGYKIVAAAKAKLEEA